MCGSRELVVCTGANDAGQERGGYDQKGFEVRNGVCVQHGDVWYRWRCERQLDISGLLVVSS